MKTVSVHIVTYNSAATIGHCIESVLKQTYPISQFIIIDNFSSDRTLSIVELYSNLTIVRNQHNVGFAEAHNQAIRMTASDFVFVLNPDMVLTDDFVEQLMRFAETKDRVGALTGKLLLSFQPEIVDSTGLEIDRFRKVNDRGAGSAAAQFTQSAEVFGVCGAAAFYSREMIRDISVFDEFFDKKFFAYKEDVDVAWRSQIFGWHSYYVSTAIGYHERNWKKWARKKQARFIRQHSYINRYRMMVKNEEFLSFLTHFVFILPYEIISNGYFLLREPFVFRAWVQFFKECKHLYRQRQFIARRRRKKNKHIFQKWLNN
ncbi:glycosyltransferase family 2 protein [Paenibacillus cymbidii]|uniref:glycosyltransferase family 2 protein n=1 Tax=Paenibacillus cymbidii TaxID=1639034 RepID=UPI00108184B8|nr:glycosyltransferase family 2 protein [Paenibacillus cymbidii]